MAVWVLASAAAVMGSIPRACVAPHHEYPFCDPKLGLDKRLDDLISRLQLEEKPLLLIGRESPKGNISRLGIPEYDWGANCIHGVQSRCSPDGRCPTSFADPNVLGASFNRSVWKGMGGVIGLELRALWLQGVGENHESNLPHLGLDCWSPNVGIQRDPRWGRNLETPSEDPALCGEFGAQVTLGLQNGSDSRYLQAVTTLKHFDANSLEGNWYPGGEYGGHDCKQCSRSVGGKCCLTRHNVDPTISKYDLFSSYLPAFKTSVVKGGAAGVMCSYNSINGTPSCGSKYLLDDVLRKEWGFRGYVSSDSGAVVDIYEAHNFTRTWPSTVAVSLSAGCDVESAPWGPVCTCGTGGPYQQYVPEAVRSGLLKEEAVDAALRNAVGLRFRLGLFDPIEDQPYWNVHPSVVQSAAHVALAKESTAQGFVLLQNEGEVLPLDKSLTKIAIIGPHTNDHSEMLGNYLGQICPDKFGSTRCVPTFYEAFRDVALSNGHEVDVVNVTGCGVTNPSTAGFAAAVAAAEAADAVIFIGGLDGSVEGEGHDRENITLPGVQANLIQAIHAVQKNLAVVLMHGGVIALDNLLFVPAIVSIGYPGRYGGEALAEVLLGKNDQAWGKTTSTWYASDFTHHFDMTSFDMTKAPGRTYRYFTGKPVFPFGHGLRYTTFDVRKTAVDADKEEKSLKLGVELRNTGVRPGVEVVMAFFTPAEGTVSTTEPASKLQRQLFDFTRVGPLMPGASKAITFDVSSDTFALVDSDGKNAVFTGKYVVTVTTGSNAPAIFDINLSRSNSEMGYTVHLL